MSSTTPNSLPGFLRRTIRSVHYEDHEYEDDDDDSDEREEGEEEEGGGGNIKALDPVLLNPVSVPVGSPYRTSLIPTGSVQNTTTATTSLSLEEEISTKKEDGHQKGEEELGEIVNLKEDGHREVFHDMDNLNLEDVEDSVDCKFRLVAKNDVKLLPDTVVTKMDVNDQQAAMAMALDPPLDTTTATATTTTTATQKASLSLEESVSTSPRENITAVASTVHSVPTKNYKEEQFEKVITCSVVDIEHLKKLAWNGIPVSEIQRAEE